MSLANCPGAVFLCKVSMCPARGASPKLLSLCPPEIFLSGLLSHLKNDLFHPLWQRPPPVEGVICFLLTSGGSFGGGFEARALGSQAEFLKWTQVRLQVYEKRRRFDLQREQSGIVSLASCPTGERKIGLAL
jgi:hypothetical protein